jgi:integrase
MVRERGPACASGRSSIPRLTPHDLRHTAASLAISWGANVKAVQRMLGHASAAMTHCQRVRRRATPDRNDRREQIAQLFDEARDVEKLDFDAH